MLDDLTIGDPAEFYGIERPDPPIYLAFLGDFDGAYDAFIDLLVKHAAPGLRRIFSLCDGFSPDADLRAWMVAHEQRPAAYYCNWVGRTVLQTREEERLRLALRDYLRRFARFGGWSAAAWFTRSLRRFVQEEKAAGRLTLTPPAPTPLGWTVRHDLRLGRAVSASCWRHRDLAADVHPAADPGVDAAFAGEFRPGICAASRPATGSEPGRLGRLRRYQSVQRHGHVEAGLASQLNRCAGVLWIIDLTARIIYTKGRLTRIHTIHFARWVYLDNRTRVFFASNYDGSLESYNGRLHQQSRLSGLNLMFGNGIGYPRTAWLMSKGAKDEQPFK